MRLIFYISVSLFLNNQAFATSWTVSCAEDEVLSDDGIDTMIRPPVCKKKSEVLKKLEDGCKTENLGACERLWEWKKKTTDAKAYEKKIFDLAEKKCLAKDAWACEEVWRVLGNTTYLEKFKSRNARTRDRQRTKEDTANMIKFIKLACKYGKETKHHQSAYMCMLAQDDYTKHY